MTTKGRFIVLEGIDGTGKTTQCQAIAKWLPTSGLLPDGAQVVLTREPGSTSIGKKIRDIVLHSEDEIAPLTELLLFAADRAQHVATVIKPALDRGDWVVCDRFTDSTVAYQGFGKGHNMGLIQELNHITLQGISAPDLVLFLSSDWWGPLYVQGDKRDRFEGQDRQFFTAVNHGYTWQHWNNRQSKMINALGSKQKVTNDCISTIIEAFADAHTQP